MIPVRLGPPAQFEALRRLLADAGYTEEAICRRVGISAIHDFRPLYDGRPGPPQIKDALDLLIRLWLDCEPVDRLAACAHLTGAGLELLESLGLIRVAPGAPEQIAGSVLLYPVESLYIASDRNRKGDWPDGTPPDIVYPAASDNTGRFLASLPEEPCESFLDLCSGTGIAALAAASRYARHAWACDLTDRSTHFAEFNRRLNGIENLTILRGDCFEPVAGLTFDRIAAHPPYMPALEQKYIFRDGGQDGELITRRIVQDLPRHLRPDGGFYCIAIASDRKGARLEKRLRQWLGPSEGEFDVLVAVRYEFHPTEYYFRAALAGDGHLTEVEQKHLLFRELEIERLVYCSLVLRRRAGGRPVFTLRRTMSPRTRREHFSWCLRWEAEAAQPASLARLLEARPVASPRVRMRILHRMLEGQWLPAECTLETDEPFVVEAKCPPWAAVLIARSDGTLTVRDHFRYFQEQGVIQPEAPEEEFARFVRHFVSAGLLEIEGFRLPAGSAEAAPAHSAAGV